jgi:flagella basal body P-ring formation protein FlgA
VTRIVGSLVCVVLLFAASGCNDCKEVREELARAQAELDKTKDELEQTRKELDTVKIALRVAGSEQLREKFEKAVEQKEDKEPPKAEALAQVVVATRDLPAGSAIDFDNVAKMDIEEFYITESMVKPEEIEAVVGKKLTIPMARGDFLLKAFLQKDRDGGEK